MTPNCLRDPELELRMELVRNLEAGRRIGVGSLEDSACHAREDGSWEALA